LNLRLSTFISEVARLPYYFYLFLFLFRFSDVATSCSCSWFPIITLGINKLLFNDTTLCSATRIAKNKYICMAFNYIITKEYCVLKLPCVLNLTYVWEMFAWERDITVTGKANDNSKDVVIIVYGLTTIT
jgi:hypothetical protein